MNDTTSAGNMPTEKELRDSISARLSAGITSIVAESEDLDLRGAIRRVAFAAGEPFTDSALVTLEGLDDAWHSPLRDAEGFYTDLRPSEAARLRDLVRAACERAAERSEAMMIDEVTAAAITFAREHPDAPRAPRMPPAMAPVAPAAPKAEGEPQPGQAPGPESESKEAKEKTAVPA
jgi:hypothetical protein